MENEKMVDLPKIKNATVSVAIVAKNEAATITQTIKSVRTIVDEIIVLVDNTTTDDTKALAEKAGADIVEFYEWKDNFAQARNEVIAKCTKEYIFIMDAHEILHPKSIGVLDEILKRVTIKKDHPQSLAGIGVFAALIYMNPAGEDLEKMVPDTAFRQPRLFKNDGNHHYEGCVHNFLATNKECTDIRTQIDEFVIIHKRTDSNNEARKKQRAEMNVKGLLKNIEENPELARNYFYLANTYFETGDHEKAIEKYKEYLNISIWNQEKAQACLMLGNLYLDRADFVEAEKCALQGISEHWERAELYILMGDIGFRSGNLYQAEKWYKSAIDMKMPSNSSMFLKGPDYTYLPHAKLAGFYSHERVADYFEAIKSAEKAVELGYPKKDILSNIKAWKNILKMKPGMKLVVLDEQGQFTFLKGICNELRKTMNVATSHMYDIDQAKWPDVIWFEWCDRNIIKASELPKREGQKWIVRLNGYENFRPGTINSIQWEKVDYLVFGAKHTQDFFNELYEISENVKQVLIPYGIDTKKWTYSDMEKSDSKNIGVIGILTEKKGPHLLGQTIKYFAKNHPEYKFLLRLDVIEKPSLSERVLFDLIKDLPNWERVARVDNLNEWMNDLKYLMSTSVLESFSYVVGETLTKGIKPLIFDWIGAKDLWPNELIWSDFDELDELLKSPYESRKYRKHIIDNYTIEKAVVSIKKLLEA